MRKVIALAAVVLSLCLAPLALRAQTPPPRETAVFAGGCFWCLESRIQ